MVKRPSGSKLVFYDLHGGGFKVQIKNEYGNVMADCGDAEKAYINWCANMAESLHIGINICNGWYCHNFEPDNPNSPKMWTENWVGWYLQNWGGKDPRRTAEDVAYSVVLKYFLHACSDTWFHILSNYYSFIRITIGDKKIGPTQRHALLLCIYLYVAMV
ncbi:hypothetical protein HN873_024151 [Arachis hypogaea]